MILSNTERILSSVKRVDIITAGYHSAPFANKNIFPKLFDLPMAKEIILPHLPVIIAWSW